MTHDLGRYSHGGGALLVLLLLSSIVRVHVKKGGALTYILGYTVETH